MRPLLLACALFAGCGPTIPDSAILEVHRSVFIGGDRGGDWFVTINDVDGQSCEEQADTSGHFTSAICPVSLAGEITVELVSDNADPLGLWSWETGEEFWAEAEASETALLTLLDVGNNVMVEIEVR